MEPRDTRLRPKKRTGQLMVNTHDPLEEIQRAGRAQEDAYFRTRDQALLVALRDTSAAEREQGMRHATRLHCPQCGEPCKETPSQRVTIEACPGCGGRGLDKGGGAVRVEPQEDGWLQRLFAGLITSTQH